MEPRTGDRVRVTLEGVYDARDYVATFILKDEATGNTIQMQKSYPKTLDILERQPVEGQLGKIYGHLVYYASPNWHWGSGGVVGRFDLTSLEILPSKMTAL